MKETLLPKLVLLNTRLVVGTYTALTLPFYTIAQRPWKQIRQWKTKRTSIEKSSDGSYIYWKRHGPPVTHPANYHLCDSFQEIFKIMKKTEDLDKPRLSYREVFSEKIKRNEKGEPLKQDGKILKEIKLSDEYKWLTARQVFERVDNLARGYASLGMGPGKKTIIYADTRIEWFLTALSLLNLNSIMVTLFSNLGNEGLVHGMKQTQANYVVTSFDLLEKISKFIDQIPNIQKIVYMRYEFQKELPLPKFPPNVELIPFDQLEEMGKTAPNVNMPVPKPDDVSLIMYTSGTTGIPKAVILTNRQLRGALISLTSNVNDLSDEAPRHIYASFLPLAHIMGFSFELFLFTGGVRIGYSSPQTLVDTAPAHLPGQYGDLRILQPTTLVAVPLILDRIVKEIYLKLSSRSPILPPIFNYLMEYKTRWVKRGYDTPIINRLVCKRVQEPFGGKLEFIVSGGAPLNEKTEEIIRAALNVKVMQGYGSTETTGGIVGMMRQDLDAGKVGYPLEGSRIKLVSWGEGGYTVDDKPNPRGEILVGGDCVAQGYYKLEEETKSAFSVDKEGIKWFHTGDIAEIFPNGSIKIIDRKKDLAKLPNGEYISLGKIESVLKTVPYVENACICLSDLFNDICALITPSVKQLGLLAKELNKSTLTRKELCQDEQVKEIIMQSILEACNKSGLHRREIPVRIHLCPEEWVPDNELLTAAFKLKRKNVLDFYQKEVKNLFKQN